MGELNGSTALFTGRAINSGRSHAVTLERESANIALLDNCVADVDGQHDLGGSDESCNTAAAWSSASDAGVSPSKWGVIGRMIIVSMQHGQYGIRVHCVAPINVKFWRPPSMINNPAAYELFCTDIDNPTREQMVERMKTLHPLDVPGADWQDVCNADLYRLFDCARMITGEVLHVSAGAHRQQHCLTAEADSKQSFRCPGPRAPMRPPGRSYQHLYATEMIRLGERHARTHRKSSARNRSSARSRTFARKLSRRGRRRCHRARHLQTGRDRAVPDCDP